MKTPMSIEEGIKKEKEADETKSKLLSPWEFDLSQLENLNQQAGSKIVMQYLGLREVFVGGVGVLSTEYFL